MNAYFNTHKYTHFNYSYLSEMDVAGGGEGGEENAMIRSNKELIDGAQIQAMADIMVLDNATSDTNIHDVHGGINIGSSYSTSGHRPIPPFLLKIFDMLCNEETNSLVSWSSTGTSFVIKNPHSFAANVLPMYFRHNNFQSFITQLNSYGFRKISWEQWEYRNDYFRKGERHLLRNIKRRTHIQQQQQHTESAMEPSFDNESQFLMKEQSLLMSEIAKLREKQRMLEEKLAELKYQVAGNERDRSITMQRILCNLRDLSKPDDDSRERETPLKKGKRKLEDNTAVLTSPPPPPPPPPGDGDGSSSGVFKVDNGVESNCEIVLEEDMGKHHPACTYISLEDLIAESSSDCVDYIRDLQEKSKPSQIFTLD
ncbi:heat stress transcription factor A-2b-like [Andrographis paniculata]|uniref:heat stress transcription factor A-2b-like n=1 Tax=Andrographis paniculata TaxID=175694 RepID=UPI0021E833D7|nr:heat stress transcription factor A-2b-like [Andrographis paniculata]